MHYKTSITTQTYKIGWFGELSSYSMSVEMVPFDR